jgi:small-conductance mechanosensitive channel
VKDIQNILNVKLFSIGSSPVTMATLATGLLVILAAYIVSKLLQSMLHRALRAKGVARGGSVGVLARLLHHLLLLTGVAVALHTAGIQLGALFAAGAVFAVGVGFAMQNIAQNFVSGVILLLERTVKPGDVVEVQGQVVRVDEMGIRATLVRTRDDEEMIVPNSTLVQATVKNYTLRDSLYRLRVTVGVTYSSDLALVRKTLEGLANQLGWRDQRRQPLVLLLEFGNSSVGFEVSVWTVDPWRSRVQSSELREAIWWAFKEQGITIAFPQVDVHFDPPVSRSLATLGKAA